MSAAFVWTLFSLLGAFVAAWGALDAYHDSRALRNHRNGRRIIARGYLRGELITLLILSAWTVIGWLAIGAGTSSTWSPALVVLVAGNALLTVRSVLDARDRLRVRRALHPPPE